MAAAFAACTNNPYPGGDFSRKVYYSTFEEEPKTLDPAVSYTTVEHPIVGNLYEGLLQYHYLKRPYELIPALAQEMPEPVTDAAGRVTYVFRIRPDALYHPDPCFAAYGGGETRAVVAADIAFQFARVADPDVGSPVTPSFEKLVGFAEFGARLGELRVADPAFAGLPVHEQYARAGGIEGVRVRGERELELVVREAYPQLLFWLAMPFTAAVPWEAVAYYDGEARPHLREHPVGSGPYRMARYEKRHRIELERHAGWYGLAPSNRGAPGTVYPGEGASGDREAGYLDPARVGAQLPVIERLAFYRDKELIPAFGKFMQGYYDESLIVKESFDAVVRGGALSPEMIERGMRLGRTVEPGMYQLGFNMDDPVVGRAGGERSRKLRQAMSLVTDAAEFRRLFLNGRGVLAQSLLPPSLFGYRAEYRNPYRQLDPERARALLSEAGYPGGVDPQTGRPLRLGFDVGNTEVQYLLQYRFFVDAWRRLGLDVQVNATPFNQFQDKLRKGAYQIFLSGWFADYPDPENFLFLLESSFARSKSGGYNNANFSNARYDELFAKMRARPNDAERQRLIDEMIAIVEFERPWIELYFREDYRLAHGWLSPVKAFGMTFPMHKYYDVAPQQREQLRAQWNEPITWPAYALAGLGMLLLVPGVLTYRRERS